VLVAHTSVMSMAINESLLSVAAGLAIARFRPNPEIVFTL
jgi:hypothetical protein